MRPLNFISTLFFIVVLVFCLSSPATACVDYHEQAPFSAVFNESQTDVELTVTDLTIFSGAPGAVCTCGFTAFSDIFDNVYYLAFVDTVNGEPIPGFDVWTSNAAASSAWENYSGSSSNWSGFVADVVNDMTPDFPVNLVIRLAIPQPADIELLFNTLSTSQLGTDEWDPEAEDLADSHNSISYMEMVSWMEVPDSYFESTGLSETIQSDFIVFPNPTKGQFFVGLKNEALKHFSVEIFNANGSRVEFIEETVNSITSIDLSSEKPGLYFIKMHAPNESVAVRKIVLD